MLGRLRVIGAFVSVLALSLILVPIPSASAASFVPLNGDGSSFAGPAINQWSRDVVNNGITINFNPDGSAQGRGNYLQNANDFAASDIQFLTSADPFGGGIENAGAVAYSYVPIVAGGTSFLYNLTVGGQRITDMRLSGLTLAKIFTGAITNWDDKAIAKDYGRQLPSQQITVVTRSDGSGASYQFTRYLAKVYPSIWQPFCKAHGGPSNCGPTEFYPGFAGSQQRAGSDQVANYISASYGQGAIGYDEYAYAKESNIPVVRLENAAGYFALPTASNVAIALQKAQIDKNPRSVTFLIQNLDNVYTNRDPRTYPLSSYSYLIVPRTSRINQQGQKVGPPARWTGSDGAAKGKTLSTWLNYVLCGAQQSAGQLGYSPLPKNLVVGGFQQNSFIPGHVGIPNLNNLNNCNNPTYHDGHNYLIQDAPFPTPCDKVGAPLNCSSGGGDFNNPGAPSSNGKGKPGGGNSNPGSGGTGGHHNQGGGTGNPGSGQGTTGPGSGTTTAPAQGGSGSSAAVVGVDPITGQTTSAAPGTSGGGAIYAEPVSVSGSAGGNGLLAGLVALEILAAVLIPGVLGIWLSRRRRPM